MYQLDIESALNAILLNSPAFPVSLENKQYSGGGTFYKQSNDPVEPDNIGIAFDSDLDSRGLYQILIHTALNTGKGDIVLAGNDLKAKFTRGTQLISGSSNAEVEKVYFEKGFEFGEYWITPCSIEYRGFNSD